MSVLIAQLIIFTFYIVYVGGRYGIQKSISDSWYHMNENWAFTIIMCYGVGILQCLHASEHFLFFISGTALCFVGAAASFKDWKLTKIVHYVGAVSAIITAIVALWLIGVIWPVFLVLAVIIVTWRAKNRIWWVEVGTFYIIILGLLEYYITHGK
jgi:hypothetical protein